MTWFNLLKRKKKYPHSDMSQARLDIVCDNDNCPAGKLKPPLHTMTAHGAPHWSECQMCGKAKVFDTATEPPVVNRDDVE